MVQNIGFVVEAIEKVWSSNCLNMNKEGSWEDMIAICGAVRLSLT